MPMFPFQKEVYHTSVPIVKGELRGNVKRAAVSLRGQSLRFLSEDLTPTVGVDTEFF